MTVTSSHRYHALTCLVKLYGFRSSDKERRYIFVCNKVPAHLKVQHFSHAIVENKKRRGGVHGRSKQEGHRYKTFNPALPLSCHHVVQHRNYSLSLKHFLCHSDDLKAESGLWQKEIDTLKAQLTQYSQICNYFKDDKKKK